MSSLKGAEMKQTIHDDKVKNAEAISAIFGATPVDGRQSLHHMVSGSLTSIQVAMDSPEGHTLFKRYEADDLTRKEYEEAIIALIPDKDSET